MPEDVRPSVPSSDPSGPPDVVPATVPDTVKGGFTLREYEARVWDMARHVLHPTFLYLLAVIVGGTRLHAHPILDEPGTGRLVEAGYFAAAFLGAWACFYSTLLRDAGLPSLTITVLVPLAFAAAAAAFLAFPAPSAMTRTEFALAAALLVGPGPVGWVATMVRWRRHRREHEAASAAPGTTGGARP